ncbi:MAG: DNA polymerase III subunit delta [Bacteroidaceae bacterium]|nr:DNA polymerase III subunit delta [Bacteroidaceae bacterium]
MQFTDIIGQESVKRRLIDDVQQGRVPHALMLCGKEGSGALPLAVAMAQYLLCTGKNPQAAQADMFGSASMFADETPAAPSGPLDHPCGHCPSCLMAEKLQHPDLHFIFPIYKRQSGKASLCEDFGQEWRELLLSQPYMGYAEWMQASGATNQQLMIYESESDAIASKLALKSSQGGYKVCIVWLPEKMNAVCANKMLKLLEEPPSETVFLMVSEQPDLLLQTIRSRTQIIEVPALPQSDIEQTLVARYGILPAEAHRIAHTADGSMTAALRAITDQDDNEEYFDLFVSLMRLSYMRRVKEMKQWSEQVASLGRERQKSMLRYCQHMVRENFIYNFHRDSLNYMSSAESDFAVRFAPFINERNVIGIMDELQLAQRDIEQNASAKIVFFDFALKMIVLIKNR